MHEVSDVGRVEVPDASRPRRWAAVARCETEPDLSGIEDVTVVSSDEDGSIELALDGLFTQHQARERLAALLDEAGAGCKSLVLRT